MTNHDERVGRALRELDVPEHGDGFFELLDERLRTEEEAQMVEGRARRKKRGRTRGAWRRPLVLVPAAVAAAVLLVLAAGPLADVLAPVVPGVVGSDVATAAEIKAKVAAAVERARTLTGTLVVVTGAGNGLEGEMRYAFSATAEGDVRLSGRNQLADGSVVTEERAYDVESRTETGYAISTGAEEYAVGWMRTNLAGGAPDQHASDLLGRRLGSIVRALLDADDPAVEETSYEGRDAWTLTADVEPNLLAEGSPDHVEITVDQQTGLPVRVVQTAGGELVQEIRLEGLVVDAELAADTFELTVPQGVEYWEEDAGFRSATLDELASVVGYEPVVPSGVPEGFELASVTAAQTAQSTGTEGMNPQSRGVVSLVYRRGFDTLVITTRLVGADSAAWSDPLSLGEGYLDRPESEVLGAGSFAGTTAEVALDPRGIPHLWALNDRLVLTVSGDASRAELVAIAESMSP